MALASGLGHTTAIAEESVYGTPVLTGARGYSVYSNTVRWQKNRALGAPLRGGDTYDRANHSAVTSVMGSGSVEMDCKTKGMGLWFRHALGASTIAQVGATPAFLQTFTPGNLLGRSLTVQAGHPLADGSLQPFTAAGSKITDWSIAVGQDELVKFMATIDSQDVKLSEGYATPNFTLNDAANVLSWAGATVFVGGSTVGTVGPGSFEISSTNGLKVDRNRRGLFKTEPVQAEKTETMLTIDTEFADMVTWVARNHSDETFGIKVDFIGSVISGAVTERLSVICSAVKVDSEDPGVDGPDILSQSIQLRAFTNGVNPAVQLEYVSTDTTA